MQAPAPRPRPPSHAHPRSVNTLPEPPWGAPFPAWVCDPALIGDMGLCTSVLTFPQRHKRLQEPQPPPLQPRLCSLAASERGASRASREGRPSRLSQQQMAHPVQSGSRGSEDVPTALGASQPAPWGEALQLCLSQARAPGRGGPGLLPESGYLSPGSLPRNKVRQGRG